MLDLIDALPLPIASLSVIVAGPVLRRLTRTSVSVWVACTAPDAITLRVNRKGASPATQVSVTPLKVGRQLWIAVLTAPAPGDIFASGQIYEYDLSANWTTTRPIDWTQLALSGASRPTFLGPPSSVSELVIFHTSCRKAHGGGRDGLAVAADVLVTRFGVSPQRQPHLLIMSGDQIYADEVGHPLAPRIRRIATDLIGIDESNVFGPLPRIGGRQAPTNGFGFTSDSAANHLWTYGEFMATYLLAWSPVLWPTTLPVFPENGTVDALDVHPNVKKASWDDDWSNLKRFLATLPAVRKILANIPSLMIFDDHEITDDWNLQHSWVNSVYTNPAGRRVITNGLVAYVLCQHWGNKPAPFAVPGSPEASLINVVSAAATAGVSPAPTAAKLLGVPIGALSAPPCALRDLSDIATIRYDFAIGLAEGWPVRIVVLDERTAREFTETDSQAARISMTALALQLPSPTQVVPLTIVVAPAPVLGAELVEDFIQPLASFLLPDGAAYVDFESWSAVRANHQDLLSRLSAYHPVVVLSGDVHYGFTAKLARDQSGATTKIAQLTASAAKNVEVKNGAIGLFSELIMRLGLERSRVVSGYKSLKPSDRAKLTVPPPAGTILPWDDTSDVLLGRVAREGASVPTALSGPVAAAYGLPPPDWTYRVEPVDDSESAYTTAAAVAEPWNGWRPKDSLTMAQALQQADLHRFGRMFVGLPQLAVITFTSASSKLTVNHELRCPVGDAADPNMHVLATKVNLT